MISREHLKSEIDAVSEQNLETLYPIVRVFQETHSSPQEPFASNVPNPLKNSVTFERDIVTSINVSWDAQARSF